MSEKPECVNLLVCESVVEDARTHNKSIQNCFNGIYAFQFPVLQDRFTIFATLTNGKGENPVSIQVVNDATKEVLIKEEGKIVFKSPMDYADITIEIRQLPFKQPGAYSVELWVAGELSQVRRFRVMQAYIKGKQA